MNLRHQVILAITPVLQQKASLSSGFEDRISKIPEKDRGLFHEMCFGSLRQFFLLDAFAKKLLSKPLKNKDLDIYAAIIIGLYQIQFMRIPDHAAISETVDAVKKLKKLWATKLVNAVLRNYIREKSSIEKQLKSDDFYSHPDWLLKHIQSAWPNNWPEILEANNFPGPITLRVNRLKATREEYLLNMELDCFPSEIASQAIVLESPCDVNQLKGFSDGVISVQDEAAQLASNLLELEPRQRVLDICSAPGGKTCHILETEPEIEELVSIEIDEARMDRVKENLTRLGLKANLVIADALETEHWWDQKLFDRILLDVPCSATGVIRRHPDIKLLRRREDIDRLATLQMQLLNKAWTLLKPGGKLVYATCSILPDENTQVLEKFIEAHRDAKHVQLEVSWGIAQPCGRQLFPKKQGHDGFYYAKLVKGE